MKLFKYYTQLLLYLSFIGFLSVNSNARTQNSTSLDINKESRFVRISLEQGLSQVSVYCIMQDTRGFMWFGTEEGLNKYDGYDFTIYRHDPDDINSLTSNYLLSLFEDSEGYLWIGTRGGLNRFDSKAEKFTRFQYEAQNPNSLSNNFVRSINEDDGGNLWIGTYGGINKLDIQERNFIHFQHQANRPHSLSNNYVRAIYEDTGDIVWVGTFRGLNKYDRKKDTFTHYQHLADNSHSISDNTVRSLLVDSRDCLWIGTRNGLDKFDKNNNKFTHYYHQVDNPASLSNSDVRTIYEDSRGSLWIGTYRGLNKLDDKKETFTRYLYDKDDQCSISNDFVWAIHEDAEGSLWIGTSGGLNEFDREEERFTSYHHQVGNPRSLSNDFVRSIYDDARGNLWIGTRGGINKFDRKEKIFTVYREKDGLPNDVIYGILGDDQNNLWLSTNKGISKFNPQTKVFNNYDVKAGLQSNEFNAGAFHRGLSGRMYFGGIKGYNEFFPDSIKSNTTIPNVVITDFLLFNKSVSVSDTSVLKQNISYTKTIILNYTDFIFAFEFSSLSYSQSEKNQFAYKLEGFNENWIDTDYKHRRATYTDLSPGEYVFRVKASNNDAYWNEKETSIKVIILPPPWRTWWAYTLYAILIMSLIIWFIQFERNKARYKQIELKRLQAIFDNTTSVMVMKDMENRFIMVNRRFEELHNINRDEAIGKTLYDIFPSELAASFVANDKEVLKKNRAIEFEDQIMFEDGLHTYISVRFPLCDTDQKPYALCGIFTDITLRKQAEEMMIQSEKMISVGGFAAGMAHELNNPLAGIIQTLQVVQNRFSRDLNKNILVAQACGLSFDSMEKYLEERDLKSMLKTVSEAAKRAARIVENMLSFSRKSESLFLPTNINELIDKTIELCSNDYDLRKNYDFRGLDIIREYDNDLPLIPCDASKIQQVLLNLLKNGAQAMAAAGIVKPGKHADKGHLILRTSSRAGMIHLEIEDNGPGMVEDIRKRVFEPFFTTKSTGAGTGLGLSLSYFIIAENHNGTLSVVSSPGVGTKFIIELPKL